MSMSCGSVSVIEPALSGDGDPHFIASDLSELPSGVDRASPFTVEIPGIWDWGVLADYIADNAFLSCSGLTSVTMPDGITEIGASAFGGCSGLTSVAISKGVTHIGDGTFFGCRSLTSIVLPEGLTRIGNDAFGWCSGLMSIVLPESVTHLGNHTFSACSGLTSIVPPEGVTRIGNDAFNGCRGLVSIVLPEGVTHIGQYAFYGCDGLTSVILPKGVSRIEHGAFYGCTWLVVVRLLSRDPSYISPEAFVDCNHLSLVVAPRASEFVGTTFQRCPLLGGAGVVEDTATNRRRAVDLQYWGVRTHQLCSAPHRHWVRTVLLVANRFRGGALSLPREMWYAILESIRRWELGRAQ